MLDFRKWSLPRYFSSCFHPYLPFCCLLLWCS